jgi:hypothetical protein
MGYDKGPYVGIGDSKNDLELSSFNGDIVVASGNGGTIYINAGKSS